MTLTQLLTEYPKAFALRDGRQVEIRPLELGDTVRLLEFFRQISESERFYLKQDVTSESVIKRWTESIDWERVIPIVAVVRDAIVADATLHRSRSYARRSNGELRIVVAPDYREHGLGSRLMRELIGIALSLNLDRLNMQMVERHEQPAIIAAQRMGFTVVAELDGWVKDAAGEPQRLIMLDLPLGDYVAWWRY